MPVDWKFAADSIDLGGIGTRRIEQADADRQRVTAEAILTDLRERPGVVLADQVGMGKTYVALAVVASVLEGTRGRGDPVVIMVPSRLRRKWEREWTQFKLHCTKSRTLDWVNSEYSHTPTEFFRLLGDRTHRCHLVFMTTGCFSLGLQDPWIKLAFIRIARRHTRLLPRQKRRVYRWAAPLVRQATVRNLTDEVVEQLMNRDLPDWKSILVEHGILTRESDDPVPDPLARHERKRTKALDWGPLCEFLRTALPARTSVNIRARLKAIRHDFTEICRRLYEDWLGIVRWKAPLLVLDEAHHAKNDTVRLAKLFRESSGEDVALLQGKFRRMLFLTATPFQLGHHELIRVLRTFGSVRWAGSRAPAGIQEEFRGQMDKLADALDSNRRAGRELDRLWGRLTREMIGDRDAYEWWQSIEASPKDAWERRFVEAVQDCRRTRHVAEELLRPWVIRHNRSPEFPTSDGQAPVQRRAVRPGKAILNDDLDGREVGLPIDSEAALPFLLSARAQGELAQTSGARAFFAEGLSSSYEAFHHTRDARGKARDMDDDGLPVQPSEDDKPRRVFVPTEWYERQVADLIQSKTADRHARLRHPKVSATVQRVVKLWEGGEKVLVFCVYRNTALALYEHLKEEVEGKVIELAGRKFDLDPIRQRDKIETRLGRIARRLSEEERPFNLEVRQVLNEPFQNKSYAVLLPYQKALVDVMAAYFRSPSFVARYLPLDDPDLREAWELGEGRPEVISRGRAALRRCIREETDQSNQTIFHRIYQFLDFAVEQAERAKACTNREEDEAEDEANDPLRAMLEAVTVYSRPRRRATIEDDAVEPDDDDGSYRVVRLVSMVYGDTGPDTRDRVAQAFNSPLFPEIMVSSAVMGEGIDLHRFCRHVIHHDGFWNPSTLEQQTGRLDRIRSKAEICRHPINVYQPFIAGSADEKMYRVLRDRERWFQVVMGQKFEFDEAASEELATRVPLPQSLAQELTFNLARWRAGTRIDEVASSGGA